jgi:amino-acid N-acetyltransferase
LRSVEALRLRKATLADLPGVLALLREASLPEDVEPHFRNFIVADRGGVLVGAVGLEIQGARALLRSLVVAPSARGIGIGSLLTRAAVEKGRERSIADLFLLTIDAAPFFEKLGFRHLDHKDAPAEIRGTREFSELCPSTARLMRLVLRPPISS